MLYQADKFEGEDNVSKGQRPLKNVVCLREYGDKVLLEKKLNFQIFLGLDLEMTGYFDFYTPERIQLIGMKKVVLSDEDELS